MSWRPASRLNQGNEGDGEDEEGKKRERECVCIEHCTTVYTTQCEVGGLEIGNFGPVGGAVGRHMQRL